MTVEPAKRRPAVRFSLATLLGLFMLMALPAAAYAGGAGISVRPRVTYGDTVGVVVEVGAFRHEECRARIGEDEREEGAPSVRTGAKGGARWSWLVPGNIDEARWHFEVACGHGRGVQRRSRSFTVGAGYGRPSRGLWIDKTMHAEAFRLPGPKGGNGSGSASLYPIGQCTWWVARRRPDLPYFAGASGDARNWARTAASIGFPTGTTPSVGAVAVFAPGQYGAGPYGHVAFVTGVSGSKMTISEDNFGRRKGPDTRTIPWDGLRFIYRKGHHPATASPIPPPILSIKPMVELRGLVQDTPVAGQVSLSAVSNQAGVRFSVHYFTDLADADSAQTVAFGEDRTAGDGFTTIWDTTTLPNQGGPGGSTVVVTATTLDETGGYGGASSSVRVFVANSRTEAGVTYWPYYVVGTCEDGECGLHLRAGPGYSGYPTTGKRYDGEELDVVCQAIGERFASPTRGDETNVWDRLTSGDWVIDYYVDTPNRGRFSQPLPRCS